MAATRPTLILRIQGDVTDIPEAVKNKIEQLTGQQMKGGKLQGIKAEEKHIIHYQRRMDAIDAGVQTLLNSVDLKGEAREKLNAHMAALKKNYNQALLKEDKTHKAKQAEKIKVLEEQAEILEEKKQTAEAREIRDKIEKIKENPGSTTPYQSILADYLNGVKKALHNQALIPETQIKKVLSRAEEYATLAQGRPVLCTVTPFKRRESGLELDQDKWMIQVEVPQDPFSEEKKQELLDVVKILRKDPDIGEKKLPEWFKIMPDSEQNLFFETFKEAQTTEDIAKKAPSISSKLRSIPGVANFSRHAFVVMDSEGTITSEDHRLRSSMVASRDIPKKKKELRHEFTTHNMQRVIDAKLNEQIKLVANTAKDGETITIPVLMQTLITPANRFGPDKRLYSDKQKAIAALREKYKFPIEMVVKGKTVSVKVELISTNHPLNEWRYLTSTGQAKSAKTKSDDKTTLISTGKTAQEIIKLIDIAKKYADRHKNNGVKKVAIALEHALTLQSSVPDREIYISALEELATSMMGGISYGSCVSGKDRKGLETMYTDAMRLYFDIYHELPPSAAEKGSPARKNFVALFTDIYVTRHQHENAGQNSPGADGIKTPEGYLPKDILNAIKDRTRNENIHKQCDRLASNNELGKIKRGRLNKLVKNISKKASSVVNILMHLTGNARGAAAALEMKVPATAIPSETVARSQQEKEIIRAIRKILPEKDSLMEATGIRQLISLIDKKGEDKVSLRELGEICRDRLEIKSKNRTEKTDRIYRAVLDLARNPASKSENVVKLFKDTLSQATAPALAPLTKPPPPTP